jgi:16S rRNA (cytosine967-C5)-methyltransferase
VKRWLARLGFDECAALCRSNNEIAPLHLRVNTLRAQRSEIIEALRSRSLAARAGELSADAIIVERGEEALGSPDAWPEWQSGSILAQDEAAQLVGRYASAAGGWSVVDACSAPGGKTTHLAQMMKDTGHIIACDLAPGRLKLVRDNAERLGVTCVETRAGDFISLAKSLLQADLVLLDAPCLGTGTWRRRPDARWKKDDAQLSQLVALQQELLEAAARVVKKGGALLYSTCSLESEENEQQVGGFLERHRGWRPVNEDVEDALRVLVRPDGFLQTWPHRHNCDGMFAAKLQRID